MNEFIHFLEPLIQITPVLIVALLLFVGLTVTSKDGWDRWIYGALSVVTLAVLIQFHPIPGLSALRFQAAIVRDAAH